MASSSANARRTMVLAFVLGLHVIFGVGLIVGTAMKIIAKQRETIVAVDVKEDKQQEVKEPPPPPPDYVPPPVAPPPTTDVPVIRGPPSETAIAAPKVQAPPPPKAEEKPAPPPVVPVQYTKDGMNQLAQNCSDMYPSASRRLSEEGSVTLEVFVGPDGKVSDAKVVTSSGFPRLDEANVKCVKGIKAFVPQKVGGQNIGSWQVMKYRWKLN
jgi:periplasmic protein TonB